MLEEILLIVVMVSSIPAGYLLAWLCRDELVKNRKWIKLVGILSLVAGLLCIIFYRDYVLILTFIYLMIISFISVRMSFRKKFVR